MRSMSACRRLCFSGWQASNKIMNRKVFALASCPANMKIKRFPRTADGERPGLFEDPPRSLAPTIRSTYSLVIRFRYTLRQGFSFTCNIRFFTISRLHLIEL